MKSRMTSSRRWRGGAGLLLVGVLGATGCADDDSGDGAAGSTTSSAVAAGSQARAGVASFEDSFEDDRNEWGVLDDPEFGSISYEGGDYVWDFRGSVAHWLPDVLGQQYDRGELEMLDVVVRAEATVEEGGGVVGVFCRETPDDDAEWQWYEFVARDGYAAIRHADLEGNLEVLAETEDVDAPVGRPIAIEAGCVDDATGVAQLSLSIDGTPLLQANDEDPLGNGVAGLQAWTFPLHEPMDVRWHEFSIHRPA